ncbi:MAG: UDP-N-acetylmuramoyl-L-alanine--D-glutamate ligase [Bacteroidota bacterium]|nr:UDP-N-acetylmuramoyl-L-alanine--D-glutamate ligase [Bacteroidota bacterium]
MDTRTDFLTHASHCTVVGAGRSGIAAALLAGELGFEVFVTESKSLDKAKLQACFSAQNIDFELGTHSERALEADFAIVSPGIPPYAPIIQRLLKQNIPIIGELEFAARYALAPIVAITGTNGKTTTTALTAHILRCAGFNAIACGNIGQAFSDVVRQDRAGLPYRRVYVVEASSYQLSLTSTFHPQVAVILNITPDHLDYHGTMEAYIQAKWKIFQNQTERDVLILCADDPNAAGASRHTQAHVEWFGLSPVERGMYCRPDDGWLVFVSSNTEAKLMHHRDLPLRGWHNVYNSMAAALAARAFEVTNENIRDSILSFTGIEHRLEHVRTVRGVEYINDSKATNVNATWYALTAFEQPIILLLGGRGEGNDYSLLDDLVRQKCRAIIAFGEEAPTIFNHFSIITRCIQVDSLASAVEHASSIAEPGDVVLLSPACKSFDQFINFEHRGTTFKELVYQLAE